VSARRIAGTETILAMEAVNRTGRFKLHQQLACLRVGGNSNGQPLLDFDSSRPEDHGAAVDRGRAHVTHLRGKSVVQSSR
jgi:hypothetical protein